LHEAMGWEFSVKVAVATTYATVTLTAVPLATVVVTVLVVVVVVVTGGLFAFVATVVETLVAESVRVARLVAVTVIVLLCNRGETTRLVEIRTAPIRTAPTMYAVLLAPGLCGLVIPTDPWSQSRGRRLIRMCETPPHGRRGRRKEAIEEEGDRMV
jgi:predicted signal transduction protein with EAL and GGDEF domain